MYPKRMMQNDTREYEDGVTNDGDIAPFSSKDTINRTANNPSKQSDNDILPGTHRMRLPGMIETLLSRGNGRKRMNEEESRRESNARSVGQLVFVFVPT